MSRFDGGRSCRRAELEAALREYHPCRFGLHVCGFTHDDRPLTLANFPVPSEADAYALWDLVRRDVAEPDGTDGDILLDLMVDGDVEDNVWMRRQMLDRLKVLAEAGA